MRKHILKYFVLFCAPFIYGAYRVRRWIDKKLNKYDPFDNRGIALSHIWRGWHRFGVQLCMAIALVAVTALPGSAMPLFAAKGSGAIKVFTAHRLGGYAAIAGATVATGGRKQQLLPFRYGTVRRRINIGNFTLTPGSQLPAVVIPQVGMLARVLFDIEGSYTPTNAQLVPANFDGMDAIIANANIQLNNGSAQIVQLSGVGINAANANLSPSLPIKRGTPGAGNVNGNNLPLATGALSYFSYKGILPVNANQRRQFEMGLINLQAPELRATINFSFNPISSVFTVPANAVGFAATINLSYEYYEIPDLTRYALPPLTLIRTIEEAPQSINATGLQIYQIPRLGTMFDYHAVFQLNQLYANVVPALGTPTVGFTEFMIRYNKTDVQYDVFMNDWETYEAELYGYGVGVAPTPSAATPPPQTQLLPYALSFNLWAASDPKINGGDFRDGIDTEENTTTEVLINVGAGTTLHAGKDNIYHIRRVVQRVLQAPAPQAA